MSILYLTDCNDYNHIILSEYRCHSSTPMSKVYLISKCTCSAKTVHNCISLLSWTALNTLKVSSATRRDSFVSLSRPRGRLVIAISDAFRVVGVKEWQDKNALTSVMKGRIPAYRRPSLKDRIERSVCFPILLTFFFPGALRGVEI